jgi:hypothetical protein
MKKIIIVLCAALLTSAQATGNAQAQSQAAQKALEGIKESVDTLVNAKDKNNPNETAFRAETFKKVIDFSIVELKDLKVKFLAAAAEQKTSSTIGMWREHILSEINKTAAFYETAKKDAEKIDENASDEEIKNNAENFKKWREENFSPLAEEINNFLLIEQQKSSIDTAEKRWEKGRKDGLKLKKVYSAKKIQPFETLLKQAQETNASAKEIYKEAQELFDRTYLSPFEEKDSTTTTTFMVKEKEDTVAASSTKADVKNDADENASSTPPISPPSIRDLIKDSLTNVKRTYQIFIEMSGLVRKLLM